MAAAVEAMNQRLDGIVEKINSGGAKEVTIPAATAENPALAALAPSLRDRSAESAAAGAAQENIAPDARALTDEEIFNKVALFLDPGLIGPILISEPINRKVFVAKYPNFGEMLTAERLLGIDTKTGDQDLKHLFEVCAELQQVVLGWVLEADPILAIIRQHPGEPDKWSKKLKPFNTTASRDPRTSYEIPALWGQYLAWKIGVTPSDDEMEKYYGLIN